MPVLLAELTPELSGIGGAVGGVITAALASWKGVRWLITHHAAQLDKQLEMALEAIQASRNDFTSELRRHDAIAAEKDKRYGELNEKFFDWMRETQKKQMAVLHENAVAFNRLGLSATALHLAAKESHEHPG